MRRTKNTLPTCDELKAAEEANKAEVSVLYSALLQCAQERDLLTVRYIARHEHNKALDALALAHAAEVNLTALVDSTQTHLDAVRSDLAGVPARLDAARGALGGAVGAGLDAAVEARKELSALEAVAEELTTAVALDEATLAQAKLDLAATKEEITQYEEWVESTRATVLAEHPYPLVDGNKGPYEKQMWATLFPAPAPEPEQPRIDIIAPAGSRGVYKVT